ncbi:MULTISPECIES: SDR family oxidoreductase [Prosthecochloris]|uniref:SDR family oxidoreductase n=1 Tax=Prosthecochloris vibrioformis TaxID=1098 RepID=A0A5C4S0Q9_PROVB|nr:MULTISPECIES: SDR family oxidoreductase [Prosthecochloris]ANT64929.1 hopanoid-associated sugar epimerase [Prosthecochloris sp. CIB 2401]TNJ36994.1 SDR family oxidoreductase [Prosthecochloris vibrioformis]
MLYTGTVLVAGATGRTGRWVVERLAHYGIEHRLFVRSGSRAIELFGPEITDRLSIGSVENETDTASAVRNAHAVISALGGNVMDPNSPPPSAIDRDGVIRLAQHAATAGVSHFILISSLAVTKPEHPLNKYGQVLSMKLEAEDEIRRMFGSHGRHYTILRPGGLIDGAPLEHTMVFDTGDRIATGKITRADVAEAAVESLWTEAARNLTFELIQGEEVQQESFAGNFAALASGS